MQFYLEYKVSMKRIQAFLELKEVPLKNMVKPGNDPEWAVQIRNQSFSWGVKTKELQEIFKKKGKKSEPEKENNKVQSFDDVVTLKDIDFNVKKGEFVCIIGDVGSGKSSLLSALNGDLLLATPELCSKF